MKRSYHSPLREQQSQQTREMILHAAAEAVVDEGPEAFSIRDVADRAGVAHRTVYRHFPGRQELLDSLSEWMDQRLEERDRRFDPDRPYDAERLLAELPDVFARFEEVGAPARAMALLSMRQRSAGHDRRTEAFRAILMPHLSHLPPDQTEEAFAVIRHLASAQTWLALTAEFGLSGRRAGEAVVRAIRAMIELEETTAVDSNSPSGMKEGNSPSK